MNSKGITPLKDHTCFICQKEKTTKTYSIQGRGYGSIFDSSRICLDCCDSCDKPEFLIWFYEQPERDACIDNYLYEENITKLFKSLPLNSQEKIYNDCYDHYMEPQDWIDYQLEELPHEKCKEYYLYSHQEIQAYKDRFPICDKVLKRVYADGSVGCWCDCGAHGDNDGSCGINISNECYMCTLFEARSGEMRVVDIAKEEENREKERLMEMLLYAIKHLKEMGVYINIAM